MFCLIIRRFWKYNHAMMTQMFINPRYGLLVGSMCSSFFFFLRCTPKWDEGEGAWLELGACSKSGMHFLPCANSVMRVLSVRWRRQQQQLSLHPQKSSVSFSHQHQQSQFICRHCKTVIIPKHQKCFIFLQVLIFFLSLNFFNNRFPIRWCQIDSHFVYWENMYIVTFEHSFVSLETIKTLFQK